MRFSLRRALTKMLVDSHLWVALAATGLTLFAQNFLGMPLVWYPAALVFASTMLIYEVDELFDRLASKSSARIGSRPWLGVGSACLYTGGVALCLNAAPSAVCYLVLCGAVPCLLYGAPVAVFNGTRMRELPGIKPFFVTTALTVAAIGVPILWTEVPHEPISGNIVLLAVCLFGITLCNVTVFDLRDRDQDARYSIRTIPVMLGVTGTRMLCVAVCAALLCLLLMSLPGSSPVIVLVCGVCATALYCGVLPANSGRLTYAIAVDGVPILLGLSIL